MRKKWIPIVAFSLIIFTVGCKEKTDNGAEAKAVLRGTVNPGTPSPYVRTHRPAYAPAPSAHLLRASTAPSPAANAQGPQKTEILEKMGVEVGNGQIMIDTHKVRDYFKALEHQIHSGLNQGVQKARQHASGVEDIGIHVGRDKVEIDLNKTKNFLKVWGESMKILGEELDRSLQPSR